MYVCMYVRNVCVCVVGVWGLASTVVKVLVAGGLKYVADIGAGS